MTILIRSSINIDEVFEVPHIVKSGETIASISYKRLIGGKGANVAVAAAAAAAASASPESSAVKLAGNIGHDGTFILHELRERGVNVDAVNTVNEPTGRAVIQLSSETKDNSIVLLPGANHADHNLALSLQAHTNRFLLLQNEIPLQQTLDALNFAHSQNATVMWNPSPMPSRSDLLSFPLHKISWLVVNETEASELSDHLGLVELSDLAQRLSDAGSSRGLVVTKGAKGCSYVLRDHTGDLPAGVAKQAIVDTTGAGDCFTGYLIAQLACHDGEITRDGIVECLKIALQAATMCCERYGAQSVPKRSEVSRILDIERSSPARIRLIDSILRLGKIFLSSIEVTSARNRPSSKAKSIDHACQHGGGGGGGFLGAGGGGTHHNCTMMPSMTPSATVTLHEAAIDPSMTPASTSKPMHKPTHKPTPKPVHAAVHAEQAKQKPCDTKSKMPTKHIAAVHRKPTSRPHRSHTAALKIKAIAASRTSHCPTARVVHHHHYHSVPRAMAHKPTHKAKVKAVEQVQPRQPTHVSSPLVTKPQQVDAEQVKPREPTQTNKPTINAVAPPEDPKKCIAGKRIGGGGGAPGAGGGGGHDSCTEDKKMERENSHRRAQHSKRASHGLASGLGNAQQGLQNGLA
ncbi:uncharacterized protein L969DRAFT_43168 [Mixia osmundae IAM 14324]|uniref:Ribokinase n=1 Tax=Mixia osmundae (strain CBS 9802 / IAM 14324 / JCM 22182 / KY 12970) TaxID=764103 RepID=G7E2X2_MIXOS|nr:uncharacterized protein L969DRAFT_43168 [Mixia osmundae IAM 14324]KEI42559.1 hypothetical protein L969DRAFT_43168 [Mixia osmundae IAM 14324]GAA97153.1 hypothetical protein E5Q_03829 [Mixia osmundae IAM 14324]